MAQASTSKLNDPPLYHIKGKSVMKACWTDMPCNCWGEHWIYYYVYVQFVFVLILCMPMRSLVYVCHMTCGITKYVYGIALCHLSNRIFTYTEILHQTLFPHRVVGSGDEAIDHVVLSMHVHVVCTANKF